MMDVALQAFSGPLDLLLYLVEKAEVDIKDIFVSEITAQFVQCLGDMHTLDMESASEFVAMAARLLYIKSRALLPTPERSPLEEEDPEEVLIRQLREYKAFKGVCKSLEKLGEEVRRFSRMPEEYILPSSATASLEGMTLDKLYEAFKLLLQREKQEAAWNDPRKVKRDMYTVADRMEHVLEEIHRKGRVAFSELFSKGQRDQLIVTFMALLELLGAGRIGLEQENRFGEIFLFGRPAPQVVLAAQ